MNTNSNLNNTNPVHIYKVTCQVCTNGIFTTRMIWANFDETALAAVTDTAERYAFKHGYTVVGIVEISANEAQSLINRGMSYSPIDDQAERDHDPSFTAEPDPEPDEVDEAAAECAAVDLAVDRIAGARVELMAKKDRSAWERGVTAYALDLLYTVEEAIVGGYADPDILCNAHLLDKAMLNGAYDWHEYSWGGSALCYDGQIAERLCCPSELKKTRNGQRRPNSREEWLDVQTRALCQAAALVKGAIRRAASM